MPHPSNKSTFVVHPWRIACVLAVSFLVGCAQMPGQTSGNARAAGGASTASADDVRFSQTDRGTMITSSERVLFETGRSDIKTEGAAFISSLVGAATRSDASLLIEGHTDNVGIEASNRELSERRADAVKQALVAGGVPSQRITTVGFGPSKPVANNDSAEGRSLNRRTEVILLGEKLENVNRDDFMFNLGRKVSALFGSVAERFQYKPTPQNFNANDRIRSAGAVTRCGERANANYLIIDGSTVEPQALRKGEQAILTINVQLCVPEGQRRTVEQTINIRKGKALIASGGKNNFADMERTRNNLFSRITVGDNMGPGSYTVESVLKLEGRDYRQTTSFTVQ